MGHYASACPEKKQKNQEANFVKEDDLNPGLFMMKQTEESVFLDEKNVIPRRFE